MPKLHFAFALSLCAAASACERGSGFPNIPATMTAATMATPWPAFLPIDDILQNGQTKDQLDVAVIRALQYRVALLKKKAAILRDDRLSEQQRINRLSALLRRAG